jgi:chorismate mutase / prephenate dehydratase
MTGKDVIDLSREEQILNKLVNNNAGPLLEKTLRAVYREIFSGSRALQQPEIVAFLGPEGTYSHDAAATRFGESAIYLPCLTITEVFARIEDGAALYGVVPMENSLEGSVRETLDQLMVRSIHISGEFSMRISHAVMNKTGRAEDIKQIASHPQALAQCRGFLNRHFPGIPLLETTSTARAAEMALKDSGIAAIGSERLSDTGLQILNRNIQDHTGNITRFIILGRIKRPPSGKDKTSLIFWTEDKPGALFEILEKFAQHNINLSRIESRPDRGIMLWKYTFFVDLEGHVEDPNVAACLEDIGSAASYVKVLGSFPIQKSPWENGDQV